MHSWVAGVPRVGWAFSPAPHGTSPVPVYPTCLQVLREPQTAQWKNPPANAGKPGSLPGLGRSPGGGSGNPLQYSCLENSHGQENPSGHSPWDEESDVTEHTSMTECGVGCRCQEG